MGNNASLEEWVNMNGKRPHYTKRTGPTGPPPVVFDALVVATVVPAQPRYKHFKAQHYYGVNNREIHALPDWLAQLPQIILYDMDTGLPKATPDDAGSEEDITM